jgi:hypothetical protein
MPPNYIDWHNDMRWALWQLAPGHARTAHIPPPHDPQAWQDWVMVTLLWAALLITVGLIFRFSILARRNFLDWLERSGKNPVP